jgi:hypothetical protein
MQLRAEDDGQITATDEMKDLAAALREARDALKAWREREDDLKGQIMEKMGGWTSAVTGRACIVRLVTVHPRPRFNANAFKSDYPDLHDAYTREVEPYVKVEV